MRKSDFAINNGKGFSMTFKNEVTISVQFSESHYCERRFGLVEESRPTERWSSRDSEIAIFGKGKWLTLEFIEDIDLESYDDEGISTWHFDGDKVLGHLEPDHVAEAIEWAINYKFIEEGQK